MGSDGATVQTTRSAPGRLHAHGGAVLLLVVAVVAGMLIAVSPSARSDAAPNPSQWGLTSFCTQAQAFPEFRRFRITNSSGSTKTVVLRNQTNGQTAQHVAPPGQSFALVPANTSVPNSANTTQLIVDGVNVQTKAANNKACSVLEGDAVCVPGTGAFTVTWTVRNNGTGPSTITASSIPSLAFAPNPVPANSTSTATETVAAPASGTIVRTLTLTVDLGSSIIGNPEATVTLGQCEGPVPSFTFTKTPSVAVADVGDVITYTYAGTNTGTVELEVTQLVDDRLGIVIEEPDVTTLVPPGGSISRQESYTVTANDAALGRIDNVAVVTVEPVGFDTPLTAVAEALVDVNPLPPPPDTLSGTATCDPATSSYSVVWSLFHPGPGDAVVISASRPVVFDPPVIPSGATAIASETVPSPATGVTVITLDLEIGPAPGSPRADASLSASVTLGQCIGQVSFTFTKTPDREITRVGEVVTYTYSGTNTGEVELLVDQLVDDRLGVVFDGAGTVPLLPGQTLTRTAAYTVTAEDASFGEIDNAAVVTGSRADLPGAPQLSAVAEAVVIVEPIPEGPDPPVLPAAGASDPAPTLLAVTALMLAGGVLAAIDRRRGRRRVGV